MVVLLCVNVRRCGNVPKIMNRDTIGIGVRRNQTNHHQDNQNSLHVSVPLLFRMNCEIFRSIIAKYVNGASFGVENKKDEWGRSTYPISKNSLVVLNVNSPPAYGVQTRSSPPAFHHAHRKSRDILPASIGFPCIFMRSWRLVRLVAGGVLCEFSWLRCLHRCML